MITFLNLNSGRSVSRGTVSPTKLGEPVAASIPGLGQCGKVTRTDSRSGARPAVQDFIPWLIDFAGVLTLAAAFLVLLILT